MRRGRFEPVVIPPPTLIDDLRRLMNNREFSDITFIVDGFQVCMYSDCETQTAGD